MMKWKDEYSTGFPDIDSQHKNLFQVINRFGDRIQEGEGHAEIEEILDFLEKYSKMHFDYEEECMLVHKCPSAAANKQAHRQFIEGYHAFRRRYEHAGATRELAQDIHDECERWLENHICKVDSHLKECLQGRST